MKRQPARCATSAHCTNLLFQFIACPKGWYFLHIFLGEILFPGLDFCWLAWLFFFSHRSHSICNKNGSSPIQCNIKLCFSITLDLPLFSVNWSKVSSNVQCCWTKLVRVSLDKPAVNAHEANKQRNVLQINATQQIKELRCDYRKPQLKWNVPANTIQCFNHFV